jgi:glutamate formiminotransferase/formiminotetrahydrofolate cyclodeaminase
MAGQLIECVPNFSEGRDRAVVQALEDAVTAVPGVVLLRSEMDQDHNRSVLTFAGPPEAVAHAALGAVEVAVARIDLSRHDGVHPRIGAADVVPFVPIRGVTLEECGRIAREVGKEIWRRLSVPVFYYEAAAASEERRPLENIRRGGLSPDLGGPALHPTAGACVVGARKLLIAFNVNLSTADVEIARAIARKVRASSGGLPFVKAIGVQLASRNLAQVSMNLTDFERTPLHLAFEAVKAEAGALGVRIVGTEIVGLVPAKALDLAAAHLLRCESFSSGLILEDRLLEASPTGEIDSFLDGLADAQSPGGGGSAAAASGAMGAALGVKLCALTRQPDLFSGALRFFREAIHRDSAAFEAVLKGHDNAIERATLVPLEIAEEATRLQASLAALDISARFHSDRETAVALARAARTGAIATVRANFEHMAGHPSRAALEQRLREIE